MVRCGPGTWRWATFHRWPGRGREKQSAYCELIPFRPSDYSILLQVRAAELLDSVILADKSVHMPYISLSGIVSDPDISHAPCHGTLCVFGTSIKLLLYDFNISVSAAVKILESQKSRHAELSPSSASHYVNFPPSHAVDGRPETSFRSPASLC